MSTVKSRVRWATMSMRSMATHGVLHCGATRLLSGRPIMIGASLDLTAWLRKRLDRSDIHLRLDYRHRFEANTEEFEFIDDVLEQYRDRNRRQGILLTYGMRW